MTASASHGNSLEIQILRFHHNLTESETLRPGPEFCVLTIPLVEYDAHSNLRITANALWGQQWTQQRIYFPASFVAGSGHGAKFWQDVSRGVGTSRKSASKEEALLWTCPSIAGQECSCNGQSSGSHFESRERSLIYRDGGAWVPESLWSCLM